jgi:hypothetical protein
LEKQSSDKGGNKNDERDHSRQTSPDSYRRPSLTSVAIDPGE